MGLPGAKRLLAGCEVPANIFTLCRGATLIIDAFVWLHCFAHVFAEAVDAGDCTSAVNCFEKRLRRLQFSGVFCLVIFDGAGSDAKGAEKQRRDVRREARVASLVRQAEEADGAALSSVEKKKLAAAGARVTPALIQATVNMLRRLGVSYTFGPVEADHQCVYEARTLSNAFIATIDQDLLVHAGVRVLLDVDWVTGGAILFDLSRKAEQLRVAAPAPPAAAAASGSAKGEGKKKAKRKRKADEDGDLTALLGLHGHGVVLAFASYSHTDYGGFKGVGEKTAIKALQLLEPGVLDPAALAAALVGVASKLRLKDVEETIVRTQTAFVAGLVFDRKDGSVRHLDGRPHSPELKFVGNFITDAAEALARSLGQRCHRVDCDCAKNPAHHHDLVDIKVVMRPGETQPTRLSTDYVPGAKLDRNILFSAPCQYTVTELDTFLRARRMPLTRGVVSDTNNNKDIKLAYVRAVFAEEEKSDKPVLLYSDGLCFIELLIARGEENARDWPQYDNAMAMACRASNGWTNASPTDIAIRGEVPVLPEAVLLKFYGELGSEQGAEGAQIRVLAEGYKRFATRAVVGGFGYLAKVPYVGFDDCCAIRVDVPRSMLKGSCKVMAILRTCAPAEGATLRRATEVVAVFCDKVCPAAAGGRCVHGSSVLQLVQNLDRPAECGEENLCTSKLCKWNMPGANVEAYVSTTPVAALPFFHAERLAEEAKRSVLAHQEDEGRIMFVPAEPGAWAEAKTVETDVFNTLYDVFAVKGKPCALATLYDDRLYKKAAASSSSSTATSSDSTAGAAASSSTSVVPIAPPPPPPPLRRSSRRVRVAAGS